MPGASSTWVLVPVPRSRGNATASRSNRARPWQPNVFGIDPEVSGRMWLMSDYLVEVRDLDRRIFPAPETVLHWLCGHGCIASVPVRRDTPDWTLVSFWAHPERVLDPQAREGASGFARMQRPVVERVVADVGNDLRTGLWDERHGHLRKPSEYDAGLRLIVATGM
jgi:hypothetical protein